MSDPIPAPWRCQMKAFYQTSGLNLRAGAAPSNGGGGAGEFYFYRSDKSRTSLGIDLLYAYAQARSKQPYFWRNDELHQVLTGFTLMGLPTDFLALGFALRGGYGQSLTRYEHPSPNVPNRLILSGFTGELAFRTSLAIFSASGLAFVLSAEAGAATYAGPVGQDAALFVRLGAGLSR